MDIPAQEERKDFLLSPFCSIRVPRELDEAHIGDGGSFSLSLFNQMVISSRNTFANTARNTVLPAIWAALRPLKLTLEINHYCSVGMISALDIVALL